MLEQPEGHDHVNGEGAHDDVLLHASARVLMESARIAARTNDSRALRSAVDATSTVTCWTGVIAVLSAVAGSALNAHGGPIATGSVTFSKVGPYWTFEVDWARRAEAVRSNTSDGAPTVEADREDITLVCRSITELAGPDPDEASFATLWMSHQNDPTSAAVGLTFFAAALSDAVARKTGGKQ